MRQKFVYTAFFILLTGIGSFTNAQTSGKPTYTVGEVTAVENGKIVMQTKDGTIDVLVSDKTEFKKVPPDNLKLAAAVDSGFSEIGVGDKLLVKGDLSADKKSVPAVTIYLTTKSAIAEKQQKESEQWKTRGISGRVTNLNFEKKEITIAIRNLTGETNVVISPKEQVKFLRYAPDSIKYSEAKPSNLTEVFVGDVVRALGDKGADGTTFKAEEVISGAFQTVGGKVKSIDAANNTVVIEDIKTKKDVTVVVSDVSTLKKFPEEMAQRMAQFQAMQASGAIRPPQANQQNNQQNNQATPPNNNGQTPGAGNGRGMRGDINEMFERLPVITVADLKVGDMIAVSSTKTDNPAQITAIRLLAGVEPFLTAPPAGNANGRGRGRGGQDSNFSIPGLDGFDVP
ncbi:hypothetical protein BH20ACI4_BH20ACI4_21050 [soil metagenome]